MSLKDLRLIGGGKLPVDILKPFIRIILRGLGYLHEVGKVVHTGTGIDHPLLLECHSHRANG